MEDSQLQMSAGSAGRRTMNGQLRTPSHMSRLFCAFDLELVVSHKMLTYDLHLAK